MTQLRLDTFVRVSPGNKRESVANDIWIAASAMQHGLPILTSDRDFQKIPQIIVHHFLPI